MLAWIRNAGTMIASHSVVYIVAIVYLILWRCWLCFRRDCFQQPLNKLIRRRYVIVRGPKAFCNIPTVSPSWHNVLPSDTRYTRYFWYILIRRSNLLPSTVLLGQPSGGLVIIVNLMHSIVKCAQWQGEYLLNLIRIMSLTFAKGI